MPVQQTFDRQQIVEHLLGAGTTPGVVSGQRAGVPGRLHRPLDERHRLGDHGRTVEIVQRSSAITTWCGNCVTGSMKPSPTTSKPWRR